MHAVVALPGERSRFPLIIGLAVLVAGSLWVWAFDFETTCGMDAVEGSGYHVEAALTARRLAFVCVGLLIAAWAAFFL